MLKERLYQAERAQLNFAAAASHELRTPLHQINAAASLLRSALDQALASFETPPSEDPSTSPSDKSVHSEILAQLDIIESSGASLGSILENIIDTLDVGQINRKTEPKESTTQSAVENIDEVDDNTPIYDLAETIESVMMSTIAAEARDRRIAGDNRLDDVEIILEMVPRSRGGWKMLDQPGPLAR